MSLPNRPAASPVKVPASAANYTPATLDPELRSQINTLLIKDGHINRIQEQLLHALNADPANWPTTVQSHALSLLRSGEAQNFGTLLRRVMEDVRQETLLANAAAPVPPPGSSFSGALPTNGTASRAADGSIVVNGHAANATKNNGLSNNDGDGASPPGAPPSDITAGSASASLADRPTGMPGSGSGGGDSEAEANPEDGEGDDENTQVGGDGDSATDANGAASSSATLGGGGDDKNKGSSPSRPPIRLRISSSGAGTTNAAGRKTSYVYSEHRSLALPRSVVEEALRTTRQSLETVCDFEAGGRGGLELL